MSPLLIIDPGHGGRDPGGGTNKYWKEKDLALKISQYQYERYQQLGVSVDMTRKSDKTISADERARIVRTSGAKYCHSNHINAGGGDGGEIIHSIHGGKDMAEKIAEELRNVGQNIRRVFTRTYPGNSNLDYYYMNRETGYVTTNIIEYGFADSRDDDVEQLREDWKLFAEAVVKAFCEFSGHTYKAPDDSEQGEPEPDPKPENSNDTRYLHLPADANSWRVYPLDVAPVKGNEKGFLRPSKFGGLSYEIEGNPQSHVYIIQTRDFGKAQIYGHPNTGATISG